MNQALLVGDVQAGITSSYPFSASVVPHISAVLTRARSTGIPIVFAVAALRPSGADLSPRNVVFNQFFSAAEVFHDGGPGPVVDPHLGRREDEPVVVKRRVSAFQATELDLILRAAGVDSLAIAGVATSAMVLATALDALDLDYSVTVLRDCCADPEPDVHDFLLGRVFPQRGATVVPSATWLP
ncbi:cysteine hydrolase family protein [Dactylosporangium sp. CA-092794]|uniref:cysteine hydrolase family protein n=1 Tax=Dactylosporangium sp. CA-092794 TaxID=3239929 RepID=UPI003D8D34CC